jgi:hypothetical protein
LTLIDQYKTKYTQKTILVVFFLRLFDECTEEAYKERDACKRPNQPRDLKITTATRREQQDQIIAEGT